MPVATLLWFALALAAGVDEFGRGTISVLCMSIGLSLLRGLLLAIPLVSLSAFAVAASEIYEQYWIAKPLRFLLDAVESVPSYLLVLAAVAASTRFPAIAGNIALAIALAPLAYATSLGVCTDIMNRPFVTTAILSGLPRREIVRRHVLPHVTAPAMALLLNLLGTATAIYGSLGAFGFANRETLDLGTLLLRGREQAPLNPALLWLTLGGYCLLFALLASAARVFVQRSRLSGAPPVEGSTHLIWSIEK